VVSSSLWHVRLVQPERLPLEGLVPDFPRRRSTCPVNRRRRPCLQAAPAVRPSPTPPKRPLDAPARTQVDRPAGSRSPRGLQGRPHRSGRRRIHARAISCGRKRPRRQGPGWCQRWLLRRGRREHRDRQCRAVELRLRASGIEAGDRGPFGARIPSPKADSPTPTLRSATRRSRAGSRPRTHRADAPLRLRASAECDHGPPRCPRASRWATSSRST
jgi:hypothetical protein